MAKIRSQKESQGRGALGSLPPAPPPSEATLSFGAGGTSTASRQAAGRALGAVGAREPALASPARQQPPPRRPEPLPRARSPSPRASPLSPPFPSLPARPCLRLLRPQPPRAPSPPEPQRGQGAPLAPPQRAVSRLWGPRPVPLPTGHTPAPPLLRQFPPDPPGGGESGRASRRAAAAAAREGRGSRQAHREPPGHTEPACPPYRLRPAAVPVGARSPGSGAPDRGGGWPHRPGKRGKEPEPDRDEKVTPPGGATRFVGEDARLLRARCHRGGRGEAEEPFQALCEYGPYRPLRRGWPGTPRGPPVALCP